MYFVTDRAFDSPDVFRVVSAIISCEDLQPEKVQEDFKLSSANL